MYATLSREVPPAVDGQTGRRAEDYLPLVRATVARVARRVPRHVERDDLMGAGLEGLAQALRSFEPSRGICFEAFAARRIRGAVLDELRRRDWAGRAVRARGSPGDRQPVTPSWLVSAGPRASTRWPPRPTSPAKRSPTSSCTSSGRLAWSARWPSARLPSSGNGDVADAALGPEATVLEAEVRDALRDAVAALPDRLRWAVVGHFGDGREMKQLAEDLGVTPSRVSQLCTEAVSLLREGIAARLDPGTASTCRPAGGRAGRRRAAYLAAMAQPSGGGPADGGPRPTAA